jgi:hypothetical protein
MATTIVPSPTFTDVVNQNFFIESQGGAKPVVSYLDAFPDSLYTKALDSVLVTFLYALLGPAGVGSIAQEYLEARLEYEDATLGGASLDQLYTSPFAFARLAEETYDIDAQASMLSAAQRAQILAQDASFRNRAIDFLKGVRAGGTLNGFELVAKSGLNHPVDVIENWRALYDQFMDSPLGLEFQGSTTQLSEVIILPRQSNATSSIQTLSISGNPFSGYFTLTYPAGPDYALISVSYQSGSSVLTVPNSNAVPVGTWLSITNAATTSAPTTPPVDWLQVNQILSPTTVQAQYMFGSQAGLNFTPGSSATRWAYIGQARSIPLPYNATAQQIRAALWAMPVIGNGNVVVTGGPLPSQDITIQFVGALASDKVPTLLTNLTPDPISGIVAAGGSLSDGEVYQMADVSSNPLTVSANVTVDTAGISATSQQTIIGPADQHAMEVALDQIRPMTCFVTTQPAYATKIPQTINTSYAANAMTQVLLYVTGESSVQWPVVDSVHWIEAGVEHEAPRALNTSQHSYQAFHNISNVIAYTEGALNDEFYNDPTGEPSPIWARYFDSMIGLYSSAQLALTPVLAQYQDPNARYDPTLVEASSPDPLVITNSVNDINIINYEYPADYLSLPGVPQLPTSGAFWSSAERTYGSDYLEIDLGSVQAVNYLYFEATSKPYLLEVAYDTLDMAPQRNFVPMYLSSTLPSVTSLDYTSAVTNPWTTVTMNVVNAMGQQVFTRFVRIGFTRNPGSTPYNPVSDQVIPYSVEVRNLRIGRSVPDTSASFQSVPGAIASSGSSSSGTTGFPSSTLYPSSTLIP